MDRYTYVDPDGVPLVVDDYQHNVHGPVAAVKTGGSMLYITESALPEVVTALYEAVGKSAPIILAAPEAPVDRDGCILGSTFEVSHYPGHVRLGFDRPGGQMLNTSPEDARFIAGLIAQHANAADASENQAEVAELANIIAAMRTAGSPPPSTEIARAALRWMRERED